MRTLGLFFMAACFISKTSALSISLLDPDYSNVKPSELLVNNMQKVLDRLSGLGVTVHPRIHHLYNLMKKELQIQHNAWNGQLHYASEILDYRTINPKHDVNKLNRIYTTEEDI